MLISALRVSNFRNLESQEITLPTQVVLVCGENGQGKTSLLEAIYTTAHARSFRSTKLRELIAWNRQEAQVSLTAQTIDGEKELECRLASGKRQIFVNGNQIEKASAYYGQLTCIAFTPESMQLVQGGPIMRRRFVDRSVSMIDPRYVDTLVQYQRALKSRNTLLATHRRELQAGSVTPSLETQLQVWEQLLARFGSQIVQLRKNFVEELQPLAARYYALLSGEREKVAMRYQTTLRSDDASSDEALLLTALVEKRMQDSLRGNTSNGPHRDELELLLDYGAVTQRARESASQGQARTLTLALSLAVMELVREKRGEPPVVLLDDVESELDLARRAALFEVLSSFKSQTILSATEPSEALRLSTTSASVLRVKAGVVDLE